MRLQNEIKNALGIWIKKVNNNSFTKNDNRWVPKLEDFCLDENPKIQGRYLLWGWGRQSGHNPQNYSWVIYDQAYPDRVQLSWKRGNYQSTRDIFLETGEDVPMLDDGRETLIEFPGWPEDCTRETDIEKQLEKRKVKKIRIEKTKKGHPAMWESGGGYTNTGQSTIIAGKNGKAKEAIYIRSRGQLANAHHALFILEVGDYIVVANHHREDFEIEILKVLDFEYKEEETYAVAEQVNYFSNGEWDIELPDFLEDAVHVAMEKATCYHCRESHFIIE